MTLTNILLEILIFEKSLLLIDFFLYSNDSECFRFRKVRITLLLSLRLYLEAGRRWQPSMSFWSTSTPDSRQIYVTLSSNWLSGISFGILLNSTLFLLLYCSDLACFFSKSITLFSSLLLTTLTIASSLLICWFAVANFVIVSDKFEIWSQRFRRSESTITFPLRLIICWTRSAFFSELIALSHKLNILLDVLLSTIMLINYVLTSAQREEEHLIINLDLHQHKQKPSSPYGY